MLEFEPGLIIWTSVSFGILVLLLYKVALPPILALLAQREKIISDSINESVANREMAKKLLEEHKQKLSEIHQSADQIVERAKKEGEKLKAELLEQAGKQAESMSERTRQDLAREKEQILAEVRRDTAELVAAAASTVLRRVVNLEDHRRMIDESISEVKA